jgi:hypothetical protein
MKHFSERDPKKKGCEIIQRLTIFPEIDVWGVWKESCE